MVDKSGLVVSHPKKEYILELNITSLDGLKDIAGKMLGRQTGIESYTHQGVKKISGFSPVDNTNWSIAFTQNEDEFLSSVYTIRNFLLAIGTVFLVLTIVAVTFFSGALRCP